MDKHDAWNRLLDALDSWSAAAPIAPGRIEVSVPEDEARRDVVIVMTPDEWDEMTSVMWAGDFDAAVADVERTLLHLQPHERFAVYSHYGLEPSTEPTLPDPPDGLAVPGGEWVAYDAEGRVASRFADWSEPEERG